MKNGKGFTISNRNKLGSDFKVPGIGSYDLNFSNKKKNPSYKIGK